MRGESWYQHWLFQLQLLAFGLFAAIAAFVYNYYFVTPAPELFVAENDIRVQSDTLPTYGQNTLNYYYIYPTGYMVSPKKISCTDFDPQNIETWCENETAFFE